LSHGLTAAFANGAPPSFEVNDQWSWTFDEKPIPLADGVFVQFFTGPGDDFVLYDEWTFILFSSIMCADTAQAADITVAGRGLISPATGVYPDKAGELIRAVLVGFAGWEAEADFDLPALAAFNAAFPYKMGLVADSPQAIGDIIDSLLTGLPALYTITSNGKFYLAEIKAPSGEAALELTDIEILEPPVGDDLGDLLYRRVYLHYNRNDCTLQNAVAELPQERLEWLRRQWRQVSARDDTILSLYPLAQDLGPLDTAIVERSEALQAARKLLSLYKTGHETLQVLTKIQPFLLDLGKIVKIRRPRFGLDQGDLFLVSGMDQDYAANEAVLTLWR
jgi:hypothetical protein